MLVPLGLGDRSSIVPSGLMGNTFIMPLFLRDVGVILLTTRLELNPRHLILCSLSNSRHESMTWTMRIRVSSMKDPLRYSAKMAISAQADLWGRRLIGMNVRHEERARNYARNFADQGGESSSYGR
jgi:hypothetical protein